MDEQTTIVMGSGSVQYSMDEAAVDIQELIDALLEAQEDGATHVVASSGNYRGAQYQSLSTYWEFASDREA